MNIKKNNDFRLIFIIFLTSFLLWAIFCFKIVDYSKNNLLENYYNIPLLNKKEDLDLSKFWLVYNVIKNNYFDSDVLEKENLVDFSIAWLIKWLWDEYSSYFSLDESKAFTDSLSWDFEWIWAIVAINTLWVEVNEIIKGSPAKDSDIRVWDIIIKANDVSLAWMTVTEAVSHIKWKAWTMVTLEILREWEDEILLKDVIRNKVKLSSVEFEKLENDIGYIYLNIFWDDTANEFKEALTELKETKGIVIDLRDNWGWYLNIAVDILSSLVEKWELLVETRYKDGKLNEYYRSVNNWNVYDGKIVVLINENSASASEIVAWALRDIGLAVIVWKKSYWKGSVQKPFDLWDWSMMKLTVAKWFTPKWVNIDEWWIIPDIEINFISEDYVNLYDRQKEEAKNILNSFIENGEIEKVVEKYLN